ncbi:transmembrane and ubiquitin-like domain-containing protein 1 [Cuculus canorus]|uniref:transmembrane and ubiquitin-like domain-containing protein 1 n=1 Tax=Cuculus canorus TaxID=55661 RepID=UPI0023AA83FD|nr:transmembrane and ubiquitin-like domain-containing protein 1 [Cuculus canorus]
MALIEGVGDEVTALFTLCVAAAVLALAWISTRAPQPHEEAPSAAPAPVERGAPVTGAGPDEAEARDRAETDSGDGEGGPGEPCMVLRLKFLNDTERIARVRPGDTVGALKRAQFPGQEHQVRLIYQGQLLRDDSQRLASVPLASHSVLHCHLAQHGPGPAPSAPRASADPVHTALNAGSLMLPLFLLLLALLWYCQLQYRHVFTATATTFLAGLTLLFSVMAFAMYRR